MTRSFRISPARFPVGAGRRRPGLPWAVTFRYSLSQRAIVALIFAREVPGRRVGRQCQPAQGKRPRGRRCVAYRLINGAIQRNADAGVNEIPFAGRVGSIALRPGTYVAEILAATPNGQSFAPRTLKFTILPATGRVRQ